MLTALAIALGTLAFIGLLGMFAWLQFKTAVEHACEPNLDAWRSPPARQPYDDRKGPDNDA